MNEELYHYGVLGMKWGVRKKDTVLRKGTRIQNISAEAPRDISKTNTLFVSNKKLDNLAYEGGYSRQLMALRGVQSVYKNDFVVTNEIRAPSQERAVKILMKMVKKDKKGAIRAVSKSIADINRLYGSDRIRSPAAGIR